MVRYPRGGFQLGSVSAGFPVGVTCLVGANGAGKSTLMRLLAGLDEPTSGRVSREGTVGHTRIGYLPQHLVLPGAARCREFLMHVAWIYGVPARQRTQRVDASLAAVGLSDRAGDRVRDLSGGMQRRLGFAQALVPDPTVLLLDEPTVGLDPVQRVAMREVITHSAADRCTIVSTHLVEDIRSLADRVVVLNRGALAFDGTLGELESRPVESGAGIGDSPLERAVTSLMATGVAG